MSEPFTALDRSFAQAAEAAAAAISVPPEKELRERMLAAALAVQLPAFFGLDVVVAAGPFRIPDWDPVPGAIDLRLLGPGGTTIVCAELKVSKTDETIWDMLKLLAALRVPEVSSAYLVVAAKDGPPWGLGREAANLFPPEPGSLLRVRTAEIFDRYWRSWTHLLLEGRARPLRAPDEFEIRSVACAPLERYPGWSLRAIAVRPWGGRWLPFQEGWPVGMAPGC